MQYKILNVLPIYGTNTYLVWDEDSKEAIMIDPAAPDKILVREIQNNDLSLSCIINTHGHGDHIGGNKLMKESFNTNLCIHRADAEMLTSPHLNFSSSIGYNLVSPKADIILKDGATIKFGNKEIEIIHTPGHTKGGICVYVDNLLFCGDTLFCDSIGRTDLPGGNFEDIKKSIREKLFILPEDTIVFPGHGPQTTIGHEKNENPFVGLAARF
ncbi:MAG: MBL fold metallo-hydrolase [Candidatus Cloacimonetes bacterium]|nr:MBL fold metallo-hydrolase [Candidatus Cloacimonadota bacterium]